jgi:hypothetical protein
MSPEVGDIWQYVDGYNNYHYLVAKTYAGTGTEDYLFETQLICLDDSSVKNLYLWPRKNNKWRFVA